MGLFSKILGAGALAAAPFTFGTSAFVPLALGGASMAKSAFIDEPNARKRNQAKIDASVYSPWLDSSVNQSLAQHEAIPDSLGAGIGGAMAGANFNAVNQGLFGQGGGSTWTAPELKMPEVGSSIAPPQAPGTMIGGANGMAPVGFQSKNFGSLYGLQMPTLTGSPYTMMGR